MKKYWLLTKTIILCGVDLGGSKGKMSLSRNLSTILSVAVIAALVAFISQSLAGVVSSDIAAGGTGFSLLEQGTSVGMLAALVMGIPMVLASFYVSSDTTTLLSFPVSLSTIAAARFTRCFFYDYSIVVLFSLPAFIAYGIAAQPGALYWVLAVITFLALPAVPVAYDAIVVMLLMRLFRRIRNKRLLTGIGSAVTFAFVGVWVFLGMKGGSNDALGMAASLSSLGGAASLFPNLVFANAALEQSSVVQLLLFLVSSVAFIVVFLLVAKAVYFESVIGMSETSTKHAALSGDEVKDFGRQRAPLAAYKHVERLKMRRSPYLMQVALTEFVWPGMLILGVGYAVVSRPEMNLTDLIGGIVGTDLGIVFLAVFAIGMSCLASAMNLVAAMSVSLEGAGLPFLKTLPIGYEQQIDAKVRAVLPIDYLIGNFLPVIVAVACVAFGMNPIALPIIVIVGFSGTVAVSYLQIIFDLFKPNLNWSDQSALGRKFSTLIATFAGIGVGLLLCAVCLAPPLLLGLDMLVSLAIVTVVSVAAAYGMRRVALAYGKKRLAQLP